MTNNEDSKVTVISATGGTLEGSAARGQESPEQDPVTTEIQTGQPTPPQAEATAAMREGERHLAGTTPASPTTPNGPEDVEYEPLIYSDPGEVTEQFDHLATRDAETMEKLPQAPEAAAAEATVADMPTEIERESLALHSANEIGCQNPEASTDHAADTVEELGAEDALRTDGLR